MIKRSYLYVVLLSFLYLTPCYSAEKLIGNVYTARITYYSTDGKWGTRVACQRSKRAKEGVSVAAHPNFKFGTKLYIPELKGKIGDGNFIVQDRGSAVTSKKASRGKAYVFDIYVTSHSKIHRFAHSQPEYMKVYVQKP
jgi:3D (Asp-Asp-Asp) domain-containing protein